GLQTADTRGAAEPWVRGAPALGAAPGPQARAVGHPGLILAPPQASQWAEAIVTVAGAPAVRGRLGAAALKAAADLRAQAPRSEELLQALLGEAAEET